jgi:hypothetical protein
MAYTPNPDREMKGGKAVVSAQELADFREKFGKDKGLRDLLNMDKGLQRKLEIPKSMRKLPANESDSNTVNKVTEAMGTFKIPTKEESAISREASMGRGTRSAEYKKGGSVSSASSRADGCAVKGKTKGRMV